MRRGFFATGVITALTPCKVEAKLEATETRTPEAGAEVVVATDEATGVGTAEVTEDTGALTAVEAGVAVAVIKSGTGATELGALAAKTFVDCGCDCEAEVTAPLELGAVTDAAGGREAAGGCCGKGDT